MSRRRKNLVKFLKQFIEMMRSSKTHIWAMLLSLFCLVLTIVLPIWRVLPLAVERPYIPLHYNIYLGVDQFGPVRNLFFLPILGLLFLFLNLILQTFFFKQEKLLVRFFAIATPLFEFVMLVAMILIILIIV